MIKNRLRNSTMLMKRKIASILLKPFKTCDLVFALESRTDVCTATYIEPDGNYHVYNRQIMTFRGEGPALILVVID